MTVEELNAHMKRHSKTQKDLSHDLGVNTGMINKAVKGGIISGWANAALEQYFTNLELKKRLDDLYPITKKKL